MPALISLGSMVLSISEILKIPENKFHPIIMLFGDSELKTKLPENVLTKGYTKYIKSKTEKILTENEVSNIVGGIKAYWLPSSFKTKRKHIQYIKSIHNTENEPRNYDEPLY